MPTSFCGFCRSTSPPAERASSVSAVIGATALTTAASATGRMPPTATGGGAGGAAVPWPCVMSPADSRPSRDAVTGALITMLPPPSFCRVSAPGTAMAPATVMSAACALLPTTTVPAVSRPSSAADSEKPVPAASPSVIGVAVRSVAAPAASTLPGRRSIAPVADTGPASTTASLLPSLPARSSTLPLPATTGAAPPVGAARRRPAPLLSAPPLASIAPPPVGATRAPSCRLTPALVEFGLAVSAT